jgi:menaquinone-dependent protoporphyrinogen IX oxidase
MKGIVVYDSSYGSTRKIAETIAESLKESGIEADLLYVKDAKNPVGNEYNFLVIGSPTRFGTMSFTVKGILGKVKSEEWANKPFAAFDTEMSQNIEKKEGSAAEKIAEKLKEKQMNQVLPVLKAVVLGLKGQLKEGEIERAKEYARKLATELKK